MQDWEVGDRLCLQLDVERNSVHAFKNGELPGLLAELSRPSNCGSM